MPFHNGEVGVGYLAVTLGASGGTAPYVWSVGGGTFPPGLNLSSDGVVTGNNTAAGNFTFTVHVADSSGGAADASKTLKVFAALAVTAACSTTCGVEEGCTICGSFGSVSGGLPPYHYTILADNRPTGMGVSGLQLTGTFPAPGPSGKFSLSIQVKDDQFGATRTVAANWIVFPHIAFTGATTYLCGNSPSSCSLQITYTGGRPGGSPTVKVVAVGPLTGVFSGPPPPAAMNVPTLPNCQQFNTVTPTTLPPGTTSNVAGGTITMNIGPPDQVNYCSYQATVTIELIDNSPCGPGNCISTNQVDLNIAF